MKNVSIPIFQTTLRIYKSDEREKFQRRFGSIPDEWYGCQTGEGIYVGENKHQNAIGTCYHEAIHFVDWLIEDRLGVELEGLEGNTELRAYMVQYVGDKIREYCVEELG